MPGSTFLVLRGILSLLVGGAAMLWENATLMALIALFAAYAFFDGIINLGLGFTSTETHDRSWTQVLAGVIGIVVGGIAVAMPGLTLLQLILFLAGWTIVRGVLDLVAAVELRKVVGGEWLLAVAGLISIAFGVLVMIFPGPAALMVTWVLGAYAALWGLVLVSLGVRLRRPVATYP